MNQPTDPAALADPAPVAAAPALPAPVCIGAEDIRALDAAARDMAIVQARRKSLQARETEVTIEVAEAKGRQLLEPEVKDALVELQNRVHERSVGAFEAMLTAITDDVIPNPTGASSIKLDLYSLRNMPALDIYHDNGGKREAITSGAMKNVVGTGLRFITLARSGMRRFMILDEADCWIEDANTRDFFSVIAQLSRDAGIQTLIITHHRAEVMEFAEQFRIYHVDTVESENQWPARDLRLLSPGNMYVSDGQEDHIAWAEATNFEGYPRARIEFAPGVTAIVGPNRHGKSAWTRAFRAAFCGDGGEEIIRHGAASTELAFGMADGRVLAYTRVRKGNPIARYVLHSAESWAAQDLENVPALHNNPGTKVPEWVEQELQMGPIDGIDVQLWPQDNPVFMLGEAASKRASLLSVGRESGYLFGMNELFKDDAKADVRLVAALERELTAGRVVIQATEQVDALVERFDALRVQAEQINAESDALAQSQRELAYLAKCQGLLTHLEQEQQALAQRPALPDILPTAALEEWRRQMQDASAAAATHPLARVAPAFAVSPTLVLRHWLDQMTQARAAARESALPAAPDPFEPAPTTALQDMCTQWHQACAQAAMARLPAALPGFQVHETALLGNALHALAELARDTKQLERLPRAPVPVEPAPTRELQTWLHEHRAAAALAASPPAVRPPADAPVAPTDAARQLLQQVRTAEADLAAAHAAQVCNQAEMKRARAMLEAATEALGEQCPVCHNQISVDDLVEHKSHHHARRAP